MRNRGPSIGVQQTIVARLTRERDEALLRETANSEILGLISQPPGDLELVFRTILEHATRMCNANFGVLHLVEGDCFRRTAHYNTPPAFLELSSREPFYRPGPKTAFARVAATKQSVHIADIAAEQLYAERDPLRVIGVEVLGIRTLVVVPMLKGSELIGAIAIFRQEVRPFTSMNFFNIVGALSRPQTPILISYGGQSRSFTPSTTWPRRYLPASPSLPAFERNSPFPCFWTNS
jgi:GAF domain-containing protein